MSVYAGLQALRLLATLESNPSSQDGIEEKLRALLTSPGAYSQKTVVVVAATIYLRRDNTKDALRLVQYGVYIET